MLVPSTYRRNLWDEFFDDFENEVEDEFFHPARRGHRGYGNAADMMRTDVKENAADYEVTMNLPGIQKENVKVQLTDGYLTVTASSDTNNDQKDDNGKYIRRERYVGSYSRSFYVGEDVKQEDIKAKFENGTLILTVPKNEQQPVVEEKNYIEIE
ncbi:MAG: Hsp20/alpha crystallin family protein [Lachnospiraceae bacterium]|nr:Hsp20/alpha crystallin family protein [Lachnospiraceae bacterium]